MSATLVSALFLTLLVSIGELNGNSVHDVGPDEEHSIEEFYRRYCNESDDTILEKLEKCENKNPTEVKQLEDNCTQTVWDKLGKKGKPSLKENRDLECDPELARQFEKCLNESMTIDKVKQLEQLYPPPQLDNIAKEIMYCDCDVYGIKHKN